MSCGPCSGFFVVLGVLCFLDFSSALQVPCFENRRFYRDPNRPPHNLWSPTECSRYHLCLEGEVFDFQCSTGLLFDVDRQICDLEAHVDNCDLTTGSTVPEPLLHKANCDPTYLACGDGTCLPQDYFCDGSIDCPDGSDEGYCNDGEDPNAASECDVDKCKKMAGCLCTANERYSVPPGDLGDIKEVPQMVLLSFDDSVNDENWDFYTRLFGDGGSNLKNPNGCSIRGTFFVSHYDNDYHRTQMLWNDGHEIAVHSVTHRSPDTWWSNNATIEDWFDEMVGQANILNKFANVRMADIRGLRAPFQGVGWNRQFLMMKEFGFEYDSSIVAPLVNPPFWPYSLDFKIPHKCVGQSCPTRPYPGLWELVVNPLEESDDLSCTTLDYCSDNLSGDEIYEVLLRNFERHYATNRAPFGLHLNSKWLKKPGYVASLKKFIGVVLRYQDVWFVTNSQAIDWMKNPIPLNKLHSFKTWGCGHEFFNESQGEIACENPNVCKLHSSVFHQQMTLRTCAHCPRVYPWVRNEFGVD